MRFAPLSRGAGLFALAALVLAGCGRPTGSVTGKVTYQGKPLKAGNVAFVTADGGRSFASGLTPEGTYTVPDLLGGEYKVCVETNSFKPPAPTGSAPVVPKGAKTGPPPGANIPEGYTPSDPAAMAAAGMSKKYVPIPPKYAEPGTTDLTYTFKGGSETFDIELK